MRRCVISQLVLSLPFFFFFFYGIIICYAMREICAVHFRYYCEEQYPRGTDNKPYSHFIEIWKLAWVIICWCKYIAAHYILFSFAASQIVVLQVLKMQKWNARPGNFSLTLVSPQFWLAILYRCFRSGKNNIASTDEVCRMHAEEKCTEGTHTYLASRNESHFTLLTCLLV